MKAGATKNTTIQEEVMARLTNKEWKGHNQVKYVFLFPNTPEFVGWIREMRRCMTRQSYRMVVRGLTSHRKEKGCTKTSVPLAKAEWLRIYIWRKPRPDEPGGLKEIRRRAEESEQLEKEGMSIGI